MNKQVNEELYDLSKNFKALNVDHKKGVLKTVQGLLRIQRAHKSVIADEMRYFDCSGITGKQEYP